MAFSLIFLYIRQPELEKTKLLLLETNLFLDCYFKAMQLKEMVFSLA
jgi:hypothetical protein